MRSEKTEQQCFFWSTPMLGTVVLVCHVSQFYFSWSFSFNATERWFPSKEYERAVSAVGTHVITPRARQGLRYARFPRKRAGKSSNAAGHARWRTADACTPRHHP